MNIEETLKTRRNEINEEIAQLEIERRKIDLVISSFSTPGETEDLSDRETAIVEAVRHGNKRPATIHKYIKNNMRLNMNIGSLRSTLSRLKTEGKINRNENGWVI